MPNMKMFRFPTNVIPHVKLLATEYLDATHTHITRTTSETVLYYILTGKLEIESGGKPIVLYPGDVCIFDKGEFQKSMGFASCSYYYLHFFSRLETVDMPKDEVTNYYSASQQKFALLTDFCYDIGQNDVQNLLVPQRMNILHSPYFKKMLSCLKSGAFDRNEVRGENFNFHANTKACELFYYLHLTASDRTVLDGSVFNESSTMKIIQYLNKNVTKKITGRDLENEFGYNFDYMNRRFKKITNSTIFAYLMQIRIDKAKTMLYTQNIPVSLVAEKVGFGNVYHFSATFKSLTGYTPTEFKKLNS